MLKSTKKTPNLNPKKLPNTKKKKISSFGKLFRIFSLSDICEQ
jgi:hypothetical protein